MTTLHIKSAGLFQQALKEMRPQIEAQMQDACAKVVRDMFGFPPVKPARPKRRKAICHR